MTGKGDLGAVVIGRNEGARLVSCLASLSGRVAPLVYVDSGSSDDSVAQARAAGALVVALDPARPFTAARARAEGFDALMTKGAPDFVQFVDGDCEVVPDWLAQGRAALSGDEKLGLVTGWRSETAPQASVFNAMADVEWRRPAGPIRSCGGDMMVRSAAVAAAGNWRADVIAAEDDEFCLRLGKAGWGLVRLPKAMTRHDLAMTRFGEWWRRALRSGHGFAQVGHLHPDFFVAERRRVWIWGALVPALFLAGLVLAPWISLAALALYAASYLNAARGLVARDHLPLGPALHQALFLTLSKLPNLLGMLTYHLRRLRGSDMRIIEYK